MQMIKDVKEGFKRGNEIDEKVAIYLREKGLSENLIKTLINTGLTDEHYRLLKMLNLNENDIDNLQDLWQAKIDKSSDSTNSTASDSSSSDRCHIQLSSSNIYLKKVLGKPLIQALCEIVAKNPADPVEYLGHWLLHYKVCEERALQQKERKSDFSIDIEKLKLKKIEDLFTEDLFIERDEEEEYGEDRNYIDY